MVILNGDVEGFVTVGEDFSFGFADVLPPYELWVLVDGASHLTVLRGLTLETLDFRQPESHFMTVSGKATGFPQPLPADHHLLVATAGPTYPRFAPPDGNFHFETWWGGEGTRTTELLGLHLKHSFVGRVFELLSYGTKTITLESGGTLAGVEIEMDRLVETRELSLTIDGGAYPLSHFVEVKELEIGGVRVDVTLAVSPPVHLPVAGALVSVVGKDANETQARWTGVARDEVHLPEEGGLRLLLPREGATGVSRSPIFTWAPHGGEAPFYLLDATADDGVGFVALLPGDATRFSPPDLSRLGWSLAGEVRWDVATAESEGIRSVDDYLLHLLGDSDSRPLAETKDSIEISTRRQRFHVQP